MTPFEELATKVTSHLTQRPAHAYQTAEASPLLAQLRREQKYHPPARRSVVAYVERAVRDAEARAAEADAPRRERERLKARHTELSALVDEQQRLLDATTPYTEVEAVSAIMLRLQAGLHLLALAELALEAPLPEGAPGGPRLPMTRDEVIELEAGRLLRWRDLLKAEVLRIAEAVNADGAAADAYFDKLVAVRVAIDLADENLGLVPRTTKQLFQEVRNRPLVEEAAREATRRHNEALTSNSKWERPSRPETLTNDGAPSFVQRGPRC